MESVKAFVVKNWKWVVAAIVVVAALAWVFPPNVQAQDKKPTTEQCKTDPKTKGCEKK